MCAKTLLTLAAALAMAASAGACASRRAAAPVAGTTTTAAGEAGTSTLPPGSGPGQAGDLAGAPGAGGPGGASAGAGPGSQQDFIVAAGERVFFDTDSYSLREDALPVIAAQAQWLQRNPAVRVIVEGNADERGTREYNLGLGARRAATVRQHLIERGVPAGRIETISYGKERPIDPGLEEAAHQRNRNARTNFQGG